MPLRNTSIAWSTVIARVISRNEPSPCAPEDVRLVQHHLVGADGVVGRRPPVVEDQREPLDELVARADHAVEPVEVVAVPGVQRGQRGPVDGRLGAGHRGGAGRAREREDRLVEPERDEPLDVAGARAEAGAPQQPLGLARAERAGVDARSARPREPPGRAAARGRRGAGRGAGRGGQRGRGCVPDGCGGASCASCGRPCACGGGCAWRPRGRSAGRRLLLLALLGLDGRAARLGLAALALAPGGSGARSHCSGSARSARAEAACA